MSKYNNFDIGITTFSLRFEFVKTLINQIRSLGIENKILLCINGEKNMNFDSEYRLKILKLCSDFDDVYPIFFTDVRGLSKMWNTLIIHSGSENILILNDDIKISTDNIFQVVSDQIINNKFNGLSLINNTFSFFLVNKQFINDLGYFDERLLGFGEEDGDIMFRIREKYGKEVDRLSCDGIENVVSNIRHDFIKSGVGKYSLFNREFIFKEKYSCDGDIYFFPYGIECSKILKDEIQYPYETFYLKNREKL